MKPRTIEVHDVQHAFLCSDARYRLFIGGIGSGKTYAGSLAALVDALPGTLGMVVAPTYPMLRDATLRTYLDVAGSLTKEFKRAEMRAVMVNGAEVLFRSGDDPDRLRGPNLSWVWLDEAAQCKSKVWDVLIGRLRAGGEAGRAWMTTTPKGMNWVFDLTTSGSPDVASFHVTTADNPYLSREFVDAVGAQYSGLFARQELGGEFVVAEGLVYEQFSIEQWPAGNIAPSDWEPDPERTIELGFDDGYVDPRAILFIQRREDGGVFVFDELYHSRHLEEVCVGEVVELCQRKEWPLPEIACGSHEAKALHVHFRRANIPARAKNHKITEGIPIVRSLVCDGQGQRSLIVHPRCKNLIAEITSGYRYPEGGRSGAHEKPADGNDHACDALRYWAYIRVRR